MEKTNANIGFEKQLLDVANRLWGHIPQTDYRNVIIGLIFLRYISTIDETTSIFKIPKEAKWNVIASSAHTPEIGTVIDTAMRAIEAENETLKNVLPKNYARPDLDKKVLSDVVDIFTNNIDMSNTKENEDLLGRTYEYCIDQFAKNEGVGGGEYYTPSSIVKVLVSVLRPFDKCKYQMG